MDRQVVIVTGGTGLLGREMVCFLRDKGNTVANFDVRFDEDHSDNFYCDLTKDESIYAAVDQVVNQYGKIDGLVNNGYPRTENWGCHFEDETPESWRTNVDWQLNSYFVITQKVIRQMKLQGAGSIVNIASIYGVVGNDFTVYEGTSMTSPAAYSAIKGGLINFTRYLASLYGKEGIRVNCVSPGGIFNHQNSTFVTNYEKQVPMRRMGKPTDIAPAVGFLLSQEAGYITGQNLIVDGGWTSI